MSPFLSYRTIFCCVLSMTISLVIITSLVLNELTTNSNIFSNFLASPSDNCISDSVSFSLIFSFFNTSSSFIALSNKSLRLDFDRDFSRYTCDLDNNALCFSREPIPTRKLEDIPMNKQVCIIPFRREFLFKYTSLEPTPLEIIESIDMMRVLENGENVRMVMTSEASYSVDTFEDLIRVEKIMESDSLMKTYQK